MRKFLLVLFMGALISCNNNTNSAEDKVDSSYQAAVDSLKSSKDSVSGAVNPPSDTTEASGTKTADTVHKRP